MSAYADRICQHLQSIGIKQKEASRYASLVSKWISNSGPEWTVERLKALKTAFVPRLQHGGRYTIPEGWATRKNSKGQTVIKDGLVHRILSSNLSNLRQIEAFLRLYQVITLEHLSKKQSQKMVKAIEGPSTVDESVSSWISNLIAHPGLRVLPPVSEKQRERIVRTGVNSLTLPDLLGPKSKRSPTFTIGSSIRYDRTVTRRNASAADWIEFFQADPEVNALWKKHIVPVSRATATSTECYSYRAEFSKNSPVRGVLSVIQSPGAKARWVANPLLAFQAIGEPLKRKLYEYSCTVFGDRIATNNQESGLNLVVSWLRDRKKVWCFDATAFTDRFPVSLQRLVLERLQSIGIVDSFDLDFFDYMVKGSWFSRDLGRNVKWTVGQPLGYGPSFHLATLTHAAVVEGLRKKLNVMGHCWSIVGDDIVISDEVLADEYKRVMSGLGVEINMSKSLVSDSYAEFLGKLISAEGINPSIKVKLFSNSNQIVSSLSYYGWSGYKYLTRDEKFMALAAFLPIHLGGVGLRFPRMPNNVWYRLTNQVEWAKVALKKDLRTLYGESSDSDSIRAKLELRSEYYHRNALPLSPTEWALAGYPSLNGLTGQPTDCTRDDGYLEGDRDTASMMNTYVYIFDSYIKAENLVDTMPLLRKDGTINRENPATCVLSDEGYVHLTEKESPLPISETTKEDLDDKNQSRRTLKLLGSEIVKRLTSGEPGDCCPGPEGRDERRSSGTCATNAGRCKSDNPFEFLERVGEYIDSRAENKRKVEEASRQIERWFGIAQEQQGQQDQAKEQTRIRITQRETGREVRFRNESP